MFYDEVMMKTLRGTKITVLLIVFVFLPALSLSALPEFTLSGGGGVLLGGLFTNYTIDADEITKYGQTKLKMTQEIQQFNIGGFVFFDATYAELAVSIQRGFNVYDERVDARAPLKGDTITSREGTGSETMLGFTLLGKYPFKLRENLFLYPLAGVSYQIALTEKRKPSGDKTYDRTEGGLATEFSNDTDFSLSMWNSWLINIGAGLDVYFNSSWYLKTEFLYSFRLMTNYEKAAIDWLTDEFDISEPKLFGSPGMRGLTHGPELRLALGYRFK